MRTLAIGDIHGCHKGLIDLLEAVAPTAEDRIVFLGDYIDRGPDSRAVLDSLLQLSETRRCVFLRGNHELMILDARQDDLKARFWQAYGGFEMLASYGAEYNTLWVEAIPQPHWDFINGLQRYLETEDHIFVHASLDPETDMEEQSDWSLFWERVEHLKPHKTGKRIICGHTPQRNGQVLNLGFAVCIDTAAATGGWLTCLDVTSDRWWQANELGETRQGSIPPISG